MPTITIPSVKQAESKLRICKSFLHALEVERHELHIEFEQGVLTQEELEQSLILIDGDVDRLKREIESTRIIQRKQSAA